MKFNSPNKLRTSVKQRQTFRLVVITGISASILTLMLILYFQFFENDITKAENPTILTQDHLPTELEIPAPVVMPADTQLREGVRYKIAKPIVQ